MDVYKIRKMKKQNTPNILSVGQIKRKLRSQESETFEKIRDNYFMYDIYEYNRKRFPVTYKEAESYANNL